MVLCLDLRSADQLPSPSQNHSSSTKKRTRDEYEASNTPPRLIGRRSLKAKDENERFFEMMQSREKADQERHEEIVDLMRDEQNIQRAQTEAFVSMADSRKDFERGYLELMRERL